MNGSQFPDSVETRLPIANDLDDLFSSRATKIIGTLECVTGIAYDTNIRSTRTKMRSAGTRSHNGPFGAGEAPLEEDTALDLASARDGFDDWTSPLGEDREVLPEGMETRRPGAELAAILEGVDRRELNGHELVRLLQARWRLIAHLQAEFYTDVYELAHTPPGCSDSPPERTDEPDEFCADEVAAALGFTPRAADHHTDVAFSLRRLPSVSEALRWGEIDLPRARILCNETAHLEVEEAARLVDALLPTAPELTTGQLARRLRRRLLDSDPDAARTRYTEGLEERGVESFPNSDGTADLCARRLPPERVAAIMRSLDVGARRLARQDPRSISQIRADLFMDLLEGTSEQEPVRRHGVEIRVDLATLMGLEEKAAEIPGWGPVIADIARRVAQQAGSQWRVIATEPEDGDPVAAFVTRRRPNTALRRIVEAHNRTCIFQGCGTPASRCHIDHTIDWSEGGKTIRINLGPICARHHLRTKHRAGWRLCQLHPGHFVWTSPRGHIYPIRPPPE